MQFQNPVEGSCFCLKLNVINFAFAQILTEQLKCVLDITHMTIELNGKKKAPFKHNYVFINLNLCTYGYTDTPDFPVYDAQFLSATLSLNDPDRGSNVT